MTNSEYSFGIYYYMDKETGLIDYIGLDSHIDDKYNRHHQHLNWKPKINFEKILQSNPDRWEYHIWYRLQTIEEASQLEYDLINLYHPRFNFKHGGIGTRKFHQDFIYTVVKFGFNEYGNQRYTIINRNRKSIVTSIDYDYLEGIALKLNNNELTEKDIIESKEFKYTVSKGGFDNVGNRRYLILDKNHNQLKNSKDKNKLIPLTNGLNDGSLSEDEVRKMNLNPFKYTVVKNGENRFRIYGKNRKSIKNSKHKDKLEKIANALNNGVISEEKVKSVNGTDKVLKLIMEE